MNAMSILKWIPAIVQLMNTAQAVKDAPGPEKLNTVVDGLERNIEIIEKTAGKDILNDPAVKVAVINAIGAVKNLENAIKAAKEIRNISDNDN